MPSKNNNPNRHLRRRDFLKSAGAAAAVAAFGVPQFVPATGFGRWKSGGANERLTLGVIGVGGRGSEHLRNMVGRMEQGKSNIAAISDVDDKRLEKALETAGPQAKAYRDYRSYPRTEGYRRRYHRHAHPLARRAIHAGGRVREAHLPAKRRPARRSKKARP